MISDVYQQKIIARIIAEEEIERIMENVDKDAQRIKTLGKLKGDSRAKQHYDPMQGRRFVDDVSGWLIGASIVALIAAAVIAAHTYDYWKL